MNSRFLFLLLLLPPPPATPPLPPSSTSPDHFLSQFSSLYHHIKQEASLSLLPFMTLFPLLCCSAAGLCFSSLLVEIKSVLKGPNSDEPQCYDNLQNWIHPAATTRIDSFIVRFFFQTRKTQNIFSWAKLCYDTLCKKIK